MRILVVAPYLPVPANTGGRRRMHALISRLARAHEVTVAAFVAPEVPWTDVEASGQICARLVAVPNAAAGADRSKRRRGQLRSVGSRWSHARSIHRTPEMQQAITEAAKDIQPDLTIVEFAQMADYDFPTSGPVVLDGHNVEYDLLRRTYETDRGAIRKLYGLVEYLKLRREERAAWSRMDACVFTSDRDRSVAQRAIGDRPVGMVPNGVDTRQFTPTPYAGGDDVIFIGADFHPNNDAVRMFADEVLPLVRRVRPSTRFVVVGGAVRGLADERRDGVVAVGPVEDVRPYLDAAAVIVAPLRMGGGTRLKILEAMAAARPVVATRIGAEGIDAAAERELLLADDTSGIADAALRVLADPDLGARLGAAGRNLVERRYDWDHIASGLDRFIRTVAAPHRAYRLALSGERVG